MMIKHKSVLPREAIESLDLRSGSVVVDATLGSGGHTEEILKKLGDDGRLIVIDIDEGNIERFRSKVKIQKSEAEGKIFLVNDNFKNIESILTDLGIGKVDAILADLGYSSDQLEGLEYGMSFLKDAPLDMRLDRKGKLDARRVVNEYPEEKLEEIIRKYGEEKFSGRIAKKIVEARDVSPIRTTKELAEMIKGVIPARFQKRNLNPATKTFQAIRIEVNSELENLEIFLEGAMGALRSGGRLSVITFHSLEDRIVKNKFRENARGCICPASFPKCVCGKKPALRLITKKPVIPGSGETEKNPRARSAKLRTVEKM
jgi:16S rRNA (cytosine1402-N4)-methyltransferase